MKESPTRYAVVIGEPYPLVLTCRIFPAARPQLIREALDAHIEVLRARREDVPETHMSTGSEECGN